MTTSARTPEERRAPDAGEVLDREALAAWLGLLRLHACLVDTLGRELQEEQGLPLTWYDVLAQLDAAGGQLRMQELAAAVLLSRSGLTRLVDRLEAAGLVVRRSCPSDRRGTFAAITTEGRAVLERAQPVHLQGIKRHFASVLSKADLRALRAAAAKIVPPRSDQSSGQPSGPSLPRC